jgi:hypothetical protein
MQRSKSLTVGTAVHNPRSENIVRRPQPERVERVFKIVERQGTSPADFTERPGGCTGFLDATVLQDAERVPRTARESRTLGLCHEGGFPARVMRDEFSGQDGGWVTVDYRWHSSPLAS